MKINFSRNLFKNLLKSCRNFLHYVTLC